MNEKKIYTILITRMLKQENIRAFPCFNGIGVISGGALWIFERNKLLIDTNKLSLNETYFEFTEESYVEAHKTDRLKDLGGNDIGVYIESNSSSIQLLVDKKMIETFDKECSFKVKNTAEPILVYEYGNLVGALAPITDDVESEDYNWKKKEDKYIDNQTLSIKEAV